MAIVVLSYWVAGKLLALIVMAFGAVFCLRAYLSQPRGLLSLTSTASLVYGRWLPLGSQPAESAQLPRHAQGEWVRSDYLGPWLVGLYVGKQRVWLWPDSVPPEYLREVRRLFHHPGR